MHIKNRKKTEEFILKWVKEITRTEFNVTLYKNLFASMSDKKFEQFMVDLRDNGNILNLIVPHDAKATDVTTENNIKVGKALGHDFFQYLIYKGVNGEPDRKSLHKFFVYLTPFRRTKQTSDKGVSVAENDKKINLLTGQVTGSSQSSKISFPELQILNGMGMSKSITELTRARGGDEGEARVMKQSLLKYGKVSRTLLDSYSTGTTSSATLKAYFASMHLEISL